MARTERHESADPLTTAHNGPRVSTEATRITFHEGGELTKLELLNGDQGDRQAVGGGKRGKILGFSAASRRRLMRRIAAVNKLASERPPAFLTLTYPREYPDDPTTYRSHARAFLKRLRRRYGDRPVIWRLEFQKRGAPHFHMLVWDLETSEEVDAWVREAWYEVVGSGDERHARHGTDLQDLKCWRRVAVYLSKYIAKRCDEDGEICEPIGRWWGVESGDLLVTEPVSMVAGFRAGIKMRRAMQKCARRRRPGGQHSQGVITFLGSDAAVRLAVFYGARFEKPRPTPQADEETPATAQRDAGRAWRMARHAWVAAEQRKLLA